MPDNNENKENASKEGEDQIKQVKSEFDRKLGNYDSRLSEMQQQNEKILQALDKVAAPPPQATKKDTSHEDLSDVMYSDPERYHKIMEQRADERADKRLDKKLAERDSIAKRQTDVLARIVNDYPEVNDPSNPLTAKTVEILNKMSAEDKQNPTNYRIAVLEAAAELGVAPKYKRKKSDDDDFVLSGEGAAGGSRKPKKKSGVNDATLDFARVMGLDTSDPKVVERIKSRQREAWYKYQ